LAFGPGKWERAGVLVKGSGGLEVVEVPLYRTRRGRIVKTLLSSACRMDCLYCPFSTHCRGPREAWRRDRLVQAVLRAWRRGLAGGLFLSSGIYGDPERVVSDMLEVAWDLREKGFTGFLHLRLMPGTPFRLVREAARVADRLGVNLEAPGPSHFSEIAPSKGRWSVDLLSRLLYAARAAGDPWRVDTQLVLGASGESDAEVVALTARLLEAGVGVVHYSPYRPVPGTPLAMRIPAGTPRWRAMLHYQAWALMRFYHYTPHEIRDAMDDRGMFRRTRNLKDELARLHPEWYPVDPEEAGYRELLRVPGIGPRSARAIIRAREGSRVTPTLLSRILGPRYKKAARYLDVKGGLKVI
jgi:predicted DNA-binding helix-hairpin-helix protein